MPTLINSIVTDYLRVKPLSVSSHIHGFSQKTKFFSVREKIRPHRSLAPVSFAPQSTHL